MQKLINVWLDLTFLVFETIIVTSLSRLLFSDGAKYLFRAVVADTSSENIVGEYEQTIQGVSLLLQFFTICLYLSVRYCIYFGISGPREFFRKICSTKKGFPSPRALQVSIVHLVSFILMCAYQKYVIKEWKYYSFENYKAHTNVTVLDGAKIEVQGMPHKSDNFKVDYMKGLAMILLNPIKEELLFRLTTISILCYRLDSKVNGVWLSSLLFGLLHCANFFSVQHKYAINYVVLQCVFAFLIGIFYALEMVITQNLMNVILLHVVNNIFASFVPVTRDVDFGDPIISYMLFVTVIIYAYYCHRGYKLLLLDIDDENKLKHT